MTILTFKAIHLIGMVAWFAGMFYLVRLFVYHAEAFDRPEAERAVLLPQYELMEKRLLKIITRPAMWLTFIAGGTLLYLNPGYLKLPWMHIKLTLVILLAGYSDYCGVIIKKLAKGQIPMSSHRFRLYNEVPTVILVAVILLATLRDLMSPLTLLGILVGLVILLVILTLLYRRYRESKEGG